MKRFLINFATALLTVFLPLSAHAAANYDKQASVNDTTLYDPKDYGQACPLPGATTGPTSTLNGNDHVTAVYNFLTGKGLTPAQAAGVMGNMIWESSLEPQRLEGISDRLIAAKDIVANLIPGLNGWGIVQWTPYTKFINNVPGKDPNLMAVQLDFLWQQLTTDPVEMPALADLKTTTTPDAAAASFKALYERSGIDTSIIQRTIYAIAVYELMVNKTPLPPNVSSAISSSPIGTSGGSSGSAAPAACAPSSTGTPGIYKNPYRDIKHFWVSRIDSGVDYGGDPGPIYAVGNAVITVVTPPINVFTGAYDTAYQKIIYKLTDGPAAGKLIYFSEDCTPVVKVGNTVTADTKICDFRNQGLNTEIGWAGSNNGFRADWIDGPNPPTGYASNSGQDFNKFMVSLGLPSGHPDGVSGVSSGGPPPGWPKW